jgi:hypothetical protein
MFVWLASSLVLVIRLIGDSGNRRSTVYVASAASAKEVSIVPTECVHMCSVWFPE